MTADQSRILIYRSAPFLMTLSDPNPAFKVTPIFDGEYLSNGTRYNIIIYDERRIGTRRWSVERCHFRSNPVIKIARSRIFNVK